MAAIHVERLIDAPAEQVWAALRDVGALHTRVAPGFVVDTRLEGDARIVTFHTGMVVKELIVDIDDTRRRVAYGIHGTPFTHHSASNQVFSETGGKSRFVWTADLLPDGLSPTIEAMMNDGADALKAVMERRPAPLAPAHVAI
jgi:uncharacterized protein YndB with AHSA1/START domain